MWLMLYIIVIRLENVENWVYGNQHKYDFRSLSPFS